MEALAEEVRRIVTSPYAVSLKSLHDIIHDVGQHAIRRWAYGNECYIATLAAAVLEGLQLWPYTLDVVRDLCCIVPFRNAIMSQKPSLLDTLLTKAIASLDRDCQYAAVCIAMLTAPLPREIPLPASLPAFFLTKLESAVEAPSALTIRPVYSLLAGVGPILLEVLPVETSSRLHEQLSRMLQSLGDRPAILLCLAIFAKVLSEKPPVYRASESPSPDLDTAPPSEAVLSDQVRRYDNIRKYFNTRRASKTLDLVVLRVVEACSSSFSQNCCEAIESLSLAQEIVRVVDNTERVSWLKKSGPMTKKLFEKVLRININVEVRLVALEFVVTLVEVDQIPMEVVTSFQDLTLMDLARPLSIWVIGEYSARFTECFIATTLLEALRLTTIANCCESDVLIALDRAKSVVSGLCSAVPGSQKLRQIILYALSSNRFSEPLARFQSHQVPARRDPASHHFAAFCFTRFGNLQRRLSQMLCSLFLTTALLANAEEISIDSSLAGALIDKQVSVGGPEDICQMRLSLFANRVEQLPLFEAGSSPVLATASHNWKSRLADELCRDATNRHDTLVRMVGEVCRDLEARCEVGEQPLREEQARSTDLRRRLESLEKKFAEVEIQQQERALVLAGLETEKDSFAAQAQEAEQRHRDLSKDLDKVYQQFSLAKEEAQRAAEAGEESTRQQELEHLASSTARDEVIEEQDVKLRSVESRARALEEQVEDLRSQSKDSQKLIGRLQNMVDERTIEVAELKASAVSNGEEIVHLRTVKSKFEVENRALQSELQEAGIQNESMTLQHKNTCELSEKEKARIQQDLDEYVSEKAAEIAKQQTRHDREIRAAQNELAQASKVAASHARRQNIALSKMQRQLDLLNKEREERAREFAQAQELSSKLMAVMGAKTGQSSAYHIENSSSEEVGLLSKSPISEETEYDNCTQIIQHSGSSASGTGGPTPKRSRPRRSFKTPFLQETKTTSGFNMATTAHGVFTGAQRQPLKDLGTDTQHQRNSTPFGTGEKIVACRMSNNNSLALDEVETGELSFEGSDIFTSTAREQTQVLGSKVPGNIYDETTADF